ncbi:hypothetical protein B0H14DRAFT_2573914 [Mycena olivaceomarginata]|nr:hypothetical protein B0H14DRAFT_2573914 [Mycena olivaceomarginata]
MHASEIGKHGTRDMTYVKFNGFYGQLQLLLVIKLEPSKVIKMTTTKIHLLAVVARSIMTQKNRLNMPHTKGKFHPVEVVDAENLEFVAGRFQTMENMFSLSVSVATMFWRHMMTRRIVLSHVSSAEAC